MDADQGKRWTPQQGLMDILVDPQMEIVLSYDTDPGFEFYRPLNETAIVTVYGCDWALSRLM
jgi:hypothetical protein